MVDVTVETKVLDLSKEGLANDTDAQTFQRESWPARRESFKENREGEPNLNRQSVKSWLTHVESLKTTANPLMILIDGAFAHSAAVHFAQKYVDYKKFRQATSYLADKMHYFSANSDQDSITRFLHYIQSIEGCEVIVKNIPRPEKSNKGPLKSVAVDITIRALREVYDNEGIHTVLILSRDPELIPTIKELKDLSINVAIARCEQIATSRHLLQEADVVLDIYDLFTTLNLYSDTQVKKHEEKEQNDNLEIPKESNT